MGTTDFDYNRHHLRNKARAETVSSQVHDLDRDNYGNFHITDHSNAAVMEKYRWVPKFSSCSSSFLHSLHLNELHHSNRLLDFPAQKVYLTLKEDLGWGWFLHSAVQLACHARSSMHHKHGDHEQCTQSTTFETLCGIFVVLYGCQLCVDENYGRAGV